MIKEHNEILNNILNRRGRQIAEHLFTLLLPKIKEEKKERGKRSTIPEMFYKTMQA